MIIGDRVIGVLSVDKFEPDFYNEELAELATAFAAQAAMAIENARLLETERAAREQAETLRAAAQSLGSTLSMSEVFDLILSELRKVVPYRSASVQRLDGDELVIVGGYGYPDLDELVGHRYRVAVDPTIPPGTWSSGTRPSSSRTSSARYAQFEDVHVEGSIKSWMAVPLLVGDRLDRDADARLVRGRLLHRRARERGQRPSPRSPPRRSRRRITSPSSSGRARRRRRRRRRRARSWRP